MVQFGAIHEGGDGVGERLTHLLAPRLAGYLITIGEKTQFVQRGIYLRVAYKRDGLRQQFGSLFPLLCLHVVVEFLYQADRHLGGLGALILVKRLGSLFHLSFINIVACPQ